MHDCVQLLHTAVGKSDLCQRSAIQAAVCQYDIFAEVGDDVRMDPLSWVHQLAPDRIRIQNVRAKRRKQPRRGGLPATQPASEANA